MNSYVFAYIGPGAGFTIAGAAWPVIAAFGSALLMLLTWPLRLLWRAVFGGRSAAKGRFKRVVVLGLDGLDYTLTERMLAEGKLPHLEALRKQGCFKPLGTTLPSISPVAWSSFQTGTNPGKHNIYDFLTPDRNTYAPKLSSVEIRPPRRTIRLGKYRIPLGKADVRLLRKSRPFWNYLGDRGVFSSIIRVPITFPPEKLRGVLLSSMCAPDLRGTQGMFSYYTTRPEREGETHRRRGPSRRPHRRLGPRRPDRAGQPVSRRKARAENAVYRRRQGARPGRSPHRRGEARPAQKRVHRLDSDSVPRRAGSQDSRPLPLSPAGSGGGVRAVRDADQHRLGKPRHADQLARRLFALPDQAARAVRHARLGRGHLGP